MTFSELMIYLDRASGHSILNGTPAETLEKARADHSGNAYATEIIKCMADRLEINDVDKELPERVQVINSLGKLRLKYMADDAPVEGFRMVEKVIAAIDSAYNEEALTRKGQ